MSVNQRLLMLIVSIPDSTCNFQPAAILPVLERKPNYAPSRIKSHIPNALPLKPASKELIACMDYCCCRYGSLGQLPVEVPEGHRILEKARPILRVFELVLLAIVKDRPWCLQQVVDMMVVEGRSDRTSVEALGAYRIVDFAVDMCCSRQ